MVSKIVSVGDKIDLIKIKSSLEDNVVARQYTSQMIDYLEEDKVKIAMPIESSRVIPLDIGDTYQLCFYTERGLYQCNAEIMDRCKDENVYILVVKFISQLEKFQRREFYRLDCILDIDYRVVKQEEIIYTKQLSQDEFSSQEERDHCFNSLNQLQTDWHPATITNISGGGARFNSKNPHNKGDEIYINILLKTSAGDKDFEMKANIISSIPITNKPGFFENRVEFSEIELEERETIIKFVFEEERKIRKREKGMV